ncbi:MAG: 1-pyrroline-5-carboxylate dehydrogenase, partial [Clostridia bacterium]|nr:1-pyrroline-5-carboxylate dehydrogenase [Clostridia bacterium]
KKPDYESMVEEIFGPILSVYVYPDDAFEETLKICDEASPYALTGAVVGQQPFGGARASGTNDKAGTALNMIRWMSPHCVKETFVPSTAIAYPYMSEK